MQQVIRQSVSSISSFTVFVACNFKNKRVKSHFDQLKRRLEDSLPIRVYLSDQVKGQGARDLWASIGSAIKESNLAIFDLTSFRPNVVLELGYALAIKQTEHIIICRDLTPSGRNIKKTEEWLLSDIPHLNRIEYRKFKGLDEQLLEHIEKMAPVKNFYRLMKEIERRQGLSSKAYISESLNALQTLRDDGPMLRKEFRTLLQDRGVNSRIIETLLIKYKLAKPESGRDGEWKLID